MKRRPVQSLLLDLPGLREGKNGLIYGLPVHGLLAFPVGGDMIHRGKKGILFFLFAMNPFFKNTIGGNGNS